MGEVLVTVEGETANGVVSIVSKDHPNFDPEVGEHYQLDVPAWDDSQVFGPEDIDVSNSDGGNVTLTRCGDWADVQLFAKI
jgi:hypothetical protein